MALFSAFLVACGDEKETSAPDPAQLLQRSIAATRDVKTFHFKLSHENGATPMPLGLQLTNAEGDVAVPDRLAADVRAKASSITASLKVVSIGDRTWITNPFTRRWQQLPNASLRDIADPARLVTSVLGGLTQPAYAGTEEVEGTQTYHLTSTVDAAKLAGALPGEPGNVAKVDLWLGRSDSLPRRVKLSGRLAASEPENIVRDIYLSKFNAAVDIQPPE